jgi:hypothetical protein
VVREQTENKKIKTIRSTIGEIFSGAPEAKPVSPAPEIDEPGSFEEYDSAPDNRFRIEALEPRILLSADPISGEFARLIQDNFDDGFDDDIAAIMQDVTEVAEVHSETQFDSVEDDLSFDWPENWNDVRDDLREEALVDLDLPVDVVADDANDVVALNQTTTFSPASWLEMLTISHALDTNMLRSGAGEVSPISKATESQEIASSDSDFDLEARGPPAIQWVTALDTIHTSGYTLEGTSLTASKEAQTSTFFLSDDRLRRVTIC